MHCDTDRVISFSMQKPVDAWWRSRGNELVVAHSSGRIEINVCTNEIFGIKSHSCNGEQNSECMYDKVCCLILLMCSSTGAPEHGTPSLPIQKLQRIKFREINERWLIYSGGCRTPPEGSDPSHVLSLYVAKKKGGEMLKSLVPFGSRVVDFICLPTDKGMKGELF